MSGKQHSAIGIGLAILIYLQLIIFSTIRVSPEVMIQVLIGTLVGSLIYDIDSKKSIASQKFTTALIVIVWFIILLWVFSEVTHINALSFIFNKVSSYLLSLHNFKWFVALAVLLTLGKISPHRGFTHKILGAFSFLIVGYFTFGFTFYIGFVLGCVAHLLADKTTSNGLKIFELRLPCQDEDGNFKVHFL